jgi:hypothetical protein
MCLGPEFKPNTAKKNSKAELNTAYKKPASGIMTKNEPKLQV